MFTSIRRTSYLSFYSLSHRLSFPSLFPSSLLFRRFSSSFSLSPTMSSSSSSSTSPPSLSLYSLLSASLTLSHEACNTIRRILATGDIKAKDKEISSTSSPSSPSSSAVCDFIDPQTAADIEAQLMITTNFLHLFGPSLSLVGEEDESEVSQYLHKLGKTQKDFILTKYQNNNSKNTHTTYNQNESNFFSHPLLDALPLPFLNHLHSTSYPMSSITIYIDPLDGTKDFTLGLYSSVTNLIGITVDGQAVSGVISVPLKDNKEGVEMDIPMGNDNNQNVDGTDKKGKGKYKFSKDFYIGVSGVGSFAFDKIENSDQITLASDTSGFVSPHQSISTVTYNDSKYSIHPLLSSSVLSSLPPSRRIICTSRSHTSPYLLSLLSSLRPSIPFIRNGGAGSKTIMVVEGVADAYVFPSLGTKKWDTAACEAVVSGMCGKMTNVYGNAMGYDIHKLKDPNGKKDFMNYHGIVCTLRDHQSYLFSAETKLDDGKHKKEKKEKEEMNEEKGEKMSMAVAGTGSANKL